MSPPYNVAYITAAVLFLINVAILAIQAAYASGHGADLGITPQFQAWLAVISAVIAAALGLLPRLQQTPQKRKQTYLLATQGVLPRDLSKQLASPPEPPDP